MKELIPTIVGAFFWAWMTEKSTRGKYGIHRQSTANYIPYFFLVLTLAMPALLRIRFNDTTAYIRNFIQADTLPDLLKSGTLHILRNPMFRIYESLIRTFTDNQVIFFAFPALFVQHSYVRFIRRHSPSFVLGIGLYLFLGTYVFSLAAMKQTLAMAILLYAVDALIDRRNMRFFLLVLLAFLFHTYAILFLILPLFTIKPWSPRTFLLLLGIVFFMRNFEGIITVFLDVANESGKAVSSSELIGTASINPIRVAVYAVPSLFALVFRRYIFTEKINREYNIIVNMAFITVSIMSIGLVSAANMFARMGQYFEFGVICGLPWMLNKPFEKSSERLIYLIAIVCFAGFFCYSNMIWMPFDDNYDSYTLLQFFELLMQDIIFG